MEVESRQETRDATELESRILDLCHGNPAGINDGIIQKDMPHITPQQRAAAINRLLSRGRIDLLKSGSQLIYKLKDTRSSGDIKGGDNQEKLIYQIVQEAGNKGIWIRDVRYKSNLLLTQVNKILKNLESKQLIKSVKSVAASRKKVYMLFNLEPDRSVTGGAWYNDQDFESEFVDVLNQQCFKFLQQKAETAKQSKTDPILQRNASYASSHDVWKFISELGISKILLSLEDIETILNTLIYDGKVEKAVVAAAGSSDSAGNSKLYRSITPLIQDTGLMRVPCGVCPVYNDCYDGGVVSSSNCVYMKEWLEY